MLSDRSLILKFEIQQNKMAEATATGTIVAGSSVSGWHSSPLLFPPKYCKLAILDETQTTATFAFKTEDWPKILDFYLAQKPGIKRPNGSASAKAEKEIKRLGKVPPGSIEGWDKRKSSFPPATEVSQYVCQTLDVNKTRTRNPDRDSHIEATHCKFAATLRTLSVGEISILTFTLGEHQHSCSQLNIHLLPWTPEERRFVIRVLMEYGSAKVTYEKVFHPEIEKCQASDQVPTRLLTMTIAKLQAFKNRIGLEDRVKPGADDFERVRNALDQFGKEGATIAYKLPGVPVESPKTIVVESAKPFLETSDLFIFLMTPLQARLLKKYGTCIATDGTHMVFSYTNIKLIVVLVGSYPTNATERVKERGFPVVMVLTTSEREDIHKAIVCHIRAGVGDDWSPRIVMTDMAFSAFNAWAHFFPMLFWLWCGFHVMQAWIKKLKNASRPEGLPKGEWSILRGKLFKEIREILCPKQPMDWEEFRTRAATVSDVLWAVGAVQLAEAWDGYIKNATRWAEPSRREAVVRVFGTGRLLPMLAKSNNSLERFFGILKYLLLGGVSIMTILDFLQVWRIYQSRIFVNAVMARVIPLLPQLSSATSESTENLTEEQLEQAAAFDSDDDDEEDASIGDSDDAEGSLDDLDDGDGDDGVDVVAYIKAEEGRVWEAQRLKAMENLSSVLSQLTAQKFGADRSFDSKGMTALCSKTLNLLEIVSAVTDDAPATADDISHLATALRFTKQRGNFDDTPCFMPTMSVPRLDRPTMPCLDSNSIQTTDSSTSLDGNDTLDKALENEPTDTTDAPTSTATVSPVTNGESDLDISSLYKTKRQKTERKEPSPEWLAALDVPFQTYASAMLTESVREKIQQEKARLACSGFPLLRIALGWNTCNRVRAIAYTLFKLQFMKSASKGDIITNFVSHLSLLVQNFPTEVSTLIADVGIVYKGDDRMQEQEIVLLRHNATSSTGEACVASCEALIGWTVRSGQLLEVGTIQLSQILWGKLIEKRRDAILC